MTFDTGGRGEGGGTHVGKQTRTCKLPATHTADTSIYTFTNVTFERKGV